MIDRSRGSAPILRADPRARSGEAPGGAVAPNPRFTTGGQAAAVADDPRYYGATNDSQIRRDRTPFFPSKARSGVGTAEVDWTMAGPNRPELHVRNVTVRVMAGTSQTRAFANPLDPSVGLHSNPKARPSGNIERFKAGAAGMKPGRRDRLSPARYSGQSYSQTTLEQGARR
jgi:hypothetical protein